MVTRITLLRPKRQCLSFLPSKSDFPQLKSPSTADSPRDVSPGSIEQRHRVKVRTHTQGEKKEEKKTGGARKVPESRDEELNGKPHSFTFRCQFSQGFGKKMKKKKKKMKKMKNKKKF